MRRVIAYFESQRMLCQFKCGCKRRIVYIYIFYIDDCMQCASTFNKEKTREKTTTNQPTNQLIAISRHRIRNSKAIILTLCTTWHTIFKITKCVKIFHQNGVVFEDVDTGGGDDFLTEQSMNKVDYISKSNSFDVFS